MPYNPQNIAAILAQMPDAFSSLQQGLKTGMIPREMELRQALARRQEEAAQRAQELQPLKEALLRAQAQKALQPQSPQSSLGKLMADRIRAQQSGASQESLKQYDQAIANAAQGSPGTQLSVDPSTGAITFQQGVRGSQPGQIVKDGVVYQKPTTGAQTAEQKAQASSFTTDYLGSQLNQPYLTATGIGDATKDYFTVKFGDKSSKSYKEAEDRIINALLEYKLRPEMGTLMTSAIGTPAQKDTLRRQIHAIGLSSIPDASLDALAFVIPKDIAAKVVQKTKDLYKKAGIERGRFVSGGYPIKTDTMQKPSTDEKIYTIRSKSDPSKTKRVTRKEAEALGVIINE